MANGTVESSWSSLGSSGEEHTGKEEGRIKRQDALVEKNASCEVFMVAKLLFVFFAPAVFFLEFLDATGGVDVFHLAGVERM